MDVHMAMIQCSSGGTFIVKLMLESGYLNVFELYTLDHMSFIYTLEYVFSLISHHELKIYKLQLCETNDDMLVRIFAVYPDVDEVESDDSGIVL
jgi:hypothetical protein